MTNCWKHCNRRNVTSYRSFWLLSLLQDLASRWHFNQICPISVPRLFSGTGTGTSHSVRVASVKSADHDWMINITFRAYCDPNYPGLIGSQTPLWSRWTLGNQEAGLSSSFHSTYRLLCTLSQQSFWLPHRRHRQRRRVSPQWQPGGTIREGGPFSNHCWNSRPLPCTTMQGKEARQPWGQKWARLWEIQILGGSRWSALSRSRGRWYSRRGAGTTLYWKGNFRPHVPKLYFHNIDRGCLT